MKNQNKHRHKGKIIKMLYMNYTKIDNNFIFKTIQRIAK